MTLPCIPPVPPSVEDVVAACSEVTDWAKLGASLGVPESDLDNISHTHEEDAGKCREALFKVGGAGGWVGLEGWR